MNHSSPFFSKLNERRVTVVMMMMDGWMRATGDKRGRDENERRLTSDGTSTRKEDEDRKVAIDASMHIYQFMVRACERFCVNVRRRARDETIGGMG